MNKLSDQKTWHWPVALGQAEHNAINAIRSHLANILSLDAKEISKTTVVRWAMKRTVECIKSDMAMLKKVAANAIARGDKEPWSFYRLEADTIMLEKIKKAYELAFDSQAFRFALLLQKELL